MRHASWALLVASVSVAALGALAAIRAPEAGGQSEFSLYLPAALLSDRLQQWPAATPTAERLPTGTAPLPTPLPGTVETPAPTPTPSPGTAETETPTPTPSVAPTTMPGDQYLFVERWMDAERGPGCRVLPPDYSATYDFDAAAGTMRVFGANPRLEIDDLGYLGLGHSMSGMGSAVMNSLLRIDALPFEAWGGDRPLRLLAVSDRGTVELRAENEDIALATGTDRRWQTVRSGEEPGCVVTTTIRITNFGYLERSKIEYGP